jgi:hypothetical protein
MKTPVLLRTAARKLVLFVLASIGLYSAASLRAGPWVNQDIGNVGAAGGRGVSDDPMTVSGAGADIYDSADAFQYVYHSWSGDGELIAHIASTGNVDAWSKIGLMFRESLVPSSPNVLLFISPQNGSGIQSRASSGGMTSFAPGPYVTAPYWLKLARSGDIFQGYQSPDGSNWTFTGSATVSLARDLYLGLAVTSHHYGVLCNAVFDTIQISNAVDVPAPPSGLVVTGLGPERVGLSWADNSTNETGFTVESSTNGVDFGRSAGGSWSWDAGPNATHLLAADPFGMRQNSRYYFHVRANSSRGNSAWSKPVAAVTLKLWPLWTNQDVGPAGLPGSAQFIQYTGGSGHDVFTHRMYGSGSDIGGSSDAFHYLYLVCQGNGTVVVHLGQFDNSNPQAKTGIMIRPSLAPDSPNVALLVDGSGNGILQSRSAAGGSTQAQPGISAGAGALKLTRSGGVFLAYQSQVWYGDSTSWTYIGSAFVNMSDRIYLGLAVSSHDSSSLAMAVTYDLNSSFVTPPALGKLTRQGGLVQFPLLGLAGANYVIDRSSDLAQWTSFLVQPNETGLTFVNDTTAANVSPRFYRTAQLP